MYIYTYIYNIYMGADGGRESWYTQYIIYIYIYWEYQDSPPRLLPLPSALAPNAKKQIWNLTF